MYKINCWEFKKCGREPGGARATELGVCNAAIESRTEGSNGGKKGGRICWALTGTLCGGRVQGTFARKVGNCMLDCPFFKLVLREEGRTMELYPSLKNRPATPVGEIAQVQHTG